MKRIMKEEYERAELDIIEYNQDDIIITSGGNDLPIIIDPQE